MLHVVVEPVAELSQIVRRYVRCHAHRDAGRTVQQQVGQLRRQHRRLELRLVVVGHHVHGVLLDVLLHFFCGLVHAHFGVAHGGRAVAVYRAEVAVAVHHRQTHGERLRHAHNRVVDGRVAVRVELAHDLAHDVGGLLVLDAWAEVEAVHAVEASPVDWFEAVAHVWQRAPDNHAHRIVDVVARKLFLDAHVFQRAGYGRAGRRLQAISVLLFFAHRTSILPYFPTSCLTA